MDEKTVVRSLIGLTFVLILGWSAAPIRCVDSAVIASAYTPFGQFAGGVPALFFSITVLVASGFFVFTLVRETMSIYKFRRAR